MLLGMMDLEKMKTTESLKRENIGRMTPKKKYRKRKGARMLPLAKATLLRTIYHTKNRRENVSRADMNPTLIRSRNRSRLRRNKKRTTPILKVPPMTTQAGRKVRKRKKVTFHHPTQKLIIGRMASPSL